MQTQLENRSASLGVQRLSLLPRETSQRLLATGLALTLALSVATPTSAWAQRGDGGERIERQDRGDRGERGNRGNRGEPDRSGSRDAQVRRDTPAPRVDQRDDRSRGRGNWHDGAHGHNHNYPSPGYVVRVLPRASRAVYWGGASYRYGSGVWYSSGPSGWVVVRPPFGVRVPDLPAFATVLTVAGIAYLYANGVYYRHSGDEGYEVVPPPVQAATVQADNKSFVYPRQGQSAAQQASDEYECHRWAVQQTGYDPTGAALSQVVPSTTVYSSNPRGDYDRARLACLDGRGYTVR